MAAPVIISLWRYPVKGLSPERLHEVDVTAGEALPFDRMYAIENGPGAFDPAAPRHLPKVTFLCLMRDERLATLSSRFDVHTHRLTLSRGPDTGAEGDLRTPEGRNAIEAFIAHDMAVELRGAPRVVSAPGHSFSDVKEKCLHIINLASLKALDTMAGRRLDPLRFRANVVIDGLPAMAELDWVGQRIRLGSSVVRVFKRTVRCAATNVDPATGVREGDIPDALSRALGHRDFGVYAMVEDGGRLAAGDRAQVVAA